MAKSDSSQSVYEEVPGAVAGILGAWMQAKNLEESARLKREQEAEQIAAAQKQSIIGEEAKSRISPLKNLIADMRASIR